MSYHYDKVLQERFWLSEEENAIINLPIFQRLRGIKQNGFSYLVYPDATGTRFDHSIGSIYWVTKLYRSIFQDSSLTLQKNSKFRALRIAALVHDIGHGPFSHALEELLYRNENWLECEPWKGLIDKYGNKSPHELLTLKYLSSMDFINTVKSKDVNSEIIKILNKENDLSLLISGDLDADRLDYLTRDSHYSGLPFGFNIKVIFNEILEKNLRIDKINGNSFLTVDADGLPAMEQFLVARYAHYKYIAYEPRILLANLVFISSLEEALEKSIKNDDDIARIVYYIFTYMNDDNLLRLDFSHIYNIKKNDYLIKLKNNKKLKNIFENFDEYCKDAKKHFIKTLNMDKVITYNFLKEGRKYKIREVENIFNKNLKKSFRLTLCLPSALTMHTCIYDPNVESRYSPSFIYDYSPIIRGLEQKMYLDCGILITSREEFDLNEIMKQFRILVRSKSDLDVYTYALVNYISKAHSVFSNDQIYWELRRTRLFEFLKYLNDIFVQRGIMIKLINFKTPWYSIEMYDVFQKLEFLDVIGEDFNVRHGEGYIPFFVYSKGEFADEIVKTVRLTDKEKTQIDNLIEEYINKYRRGLP